MQKGQRFSQLYLDKGRPVNDNERMRNRISAYYVQNLYKFNDEIAALIKTKTGAVVPCNIGVQEFFMKNQIRDVLDSITLIYKYCAENNNLLVANEWKNFVSNVFEEENVGYRLDEKCGVHFFIDEEFERNKSAVIACLSESNQPAVLEAFKKSYSFLDQIAPDTASSIRLIFEATEILYKHIVNAEGNDRLNSSGVKNKLKPLLLATIKDNSVAQTACGHMLDSLSGWIEAGHMYRHGQKNKEPLSPPLDFAVLYISQGAAYIRYLLPLAIINENKQG